MVRRLFHISYRFSVTVTFIAPYNIKTKLLLETVGAERDQLFLFLDFCLPSFTAESTQNDGSG